MGAEDVELPTSLAPVLFFDVNDLFAVIPGSRF
jgi:hypothetical protein